MTIHLKPDTMIAFSLLRELASLQFRNYFSDSRHWVNPRMFFGKLVEVSVLVLSVSSCTGQRPANQTTGPSKEQRTIKVGGRFEHSKLMFVGMPEMVSSSDTTAGWREPGQKMVLEGTVYLPDGINPDSDVLIYYYHTNHEGKYEHKESVSRSLDSGSSGQTHGYLRGWVKTGKAGSYQIYTSRPAPYPGNTMAAHIHMSVKENNQLSEYYLDDILFSDDAILPGFLKRYPQAERGGKAIVTPVEKDGIQFFRRDIYLGKNIPSYPKS